MYAPQRSYNSRCIRNLEEGTLLQTYYNKSNNHTSKSNTHMTVGSIIKYVNGPSVHYPLLNKIATASAKSCSKLQFLIRGIATCNYGYITFVELADVLHVHNSVSYEAILLLSVVNYRISEVEFKRSQLMLFKHQNTISLNTENTQKVQINLYKTKIAK